MKQRAIALIPVGKVTEDDVRRAAERLVKVLRQPVEVRSPVDLPVGVVEGDRNQARAANLIASLHAERFRSKTGTLVGSEEGQTRPLTKPELWVYVTDVDMYTSKTDGVFSALSPSQQTGVSSIRRTREAFYRRPANLNAQKVRLVKELLRVIARLIGLRECGDPACALSATRGVPDLDTKKEMYCRNCAGILFEGRLKT